MSRIGSFLRIDPTSTSPQSSPSSKVRIFFKASINEFQRYDHFKKCAKCILVYTLSTKSRRTQIFFQIFTMDVSGNQISKY